MKLLVTGFEPFGGEAINPAWETVKGLPDEIAGAQIVKLEVPTVFGLSIEMVAEAIALHQPDVVLSIGQAGGRYALSVERVGININDGRIADNAGYQPIDEPIDPEGAPAYFSTLPIKAMVEGIREAGVPAVVSNSAGTYVCNHLMYGVLNNIAVHKLPIKAGFIHIPYVTSQVVGKKDMPCLGAQELIDGIAAAIRVIATVAQDIKVAEGAIH